ncbi:hypothetical protein R1sor_005340 [Riccia sorocarpa]|uniref:Early light-induced protein n=1 Tax=Riccia sorocarpa TaxID=122646 RepID=A0ABD3HMX6_9MARC
MAAIMSLVNVSAAANINANVGTTLQRQNAPSTANWTGVMALRRRTFTSPRCAAGKDDPIVSPTGVQEAVDRASKKTITKEAILENQEKNESEQRSVFGSKPSSGAPYPRPEIERRPETGDRGFFSVFAFDGAAPETINGRAAMLGFVWAFLAEQATGLTVIEQLFQPGNPGLVYFIGAVQVVTYASLIPIMKGESTDARSFGPFTARAERWNGRLAMIGFAALIISELIHQTPVFH